MISYRKVGGLRFLTIGRFQISICRLRRGVKRRKVVEIRPIKGDPLAPLLSSSGSFQSEPNPFGYTPAPDPVIWTHL